MSSRLQQRRARIRAEYGFDFPEDFYSFWDFACRLSPLDPLNALSELGITLVGPFEILAGRFDGRVPRRSLLLHWRYYANPPEFFTVFYCESLHWGYWLDDPDRGPDGCVVFCNTQEATLEVQGDDLFDAVRLQIEHLHADLEVLSEDDPESAAQEFAELALLRDRLPPNGRSEIGSAYTDTYEGRSRRNVHVVAQFMNGVGIVVPRNQYRPLRPDKQLWPYLRRTKDPKGVVEEANQALREGYPGTALKLGQDLWGMAGTRGVYAAELLESAYTALGRQCLLQVLQTHVANRELPSVDILDE